MLGGAFNGHPAKFSPMALVYNRLAGQSIERIAALSDGIFAVAMTLLILEIHVPAAEGVHSEHDLARVLESLSASRLVYLMSFFDPGDLLERSAGPAQSFCPRR